MILEKTYNPKVKLALPIVIKHQRMVLGTKLNPKAKPMLLLIILHNLILRRINKRRVSLTLLAVNCRIIVWGNKVSHKVKLSLA